MQSFGDDVQTCARRRQRQQRRQRRRQHSALRRRSTPTIHMGLALLLCLGISTCTHTHTHTLRDSVEEAAITRVTLPCDAQKRIRVRNELKKRMKQRKRNNFHTNSLKDIHIRHGNPTKTGHTHTHTHEGNDPTCSECKKKRQSLEVNLMSMDLGMDLTLSHK